MIELMKSVEERRKEMAEKAKAIHYPRCWDTAVFSTVAKALRQYERDQPLKCSLCDVSKWH